ILFLFMSLMNRYINLKNILWIFTFFYLISNPNKFAFDISFHLVFLACFSIIYLNFLFEKINIHTYKKAFLISIFTTIFIMPYIFYIFSGISLLSFISNLLGAIVVSLITILGFLSILFSFIFNDLNYFISFILKLFIDYFILLGDIFFGFYLDYKGNKINLFFIVLIYVIYLIIYFLFFMKTKIKI
ncbi:MAG: ComEC/Rec2 family competence protein, partial [Patescibacteria group bacterium]|nr:ComEC/Rec2 family competence protein [Patescibacteria group bacterium]